ncbi:DnaB-like helicase N-terminal domain-containing protein [Actinacidiphila rubida]|uniref:AAA domain-containing protein n=1 Tax=Actinacidiphila rubida TaxID=310780 RepID=A0A1H8SWG9_9ACTN|nr:DnaB-like helicase N-terminal domain-containing protein [Actinacidiphila rubida]SEO83100.1 AAA domain-containing protein [Actinacidiphila rubida]
MENVRHLNPRDEDAAGGGRMPPHDPAAEQSVLGAMLLDPHTIPDVIAAMDPGDHLRPAHETIHRAIIGLYERGAAIDPITLVADLQRTGDLLRAGGVPYVSGLPSAVPVAINAPEYAARVHDLARRRRLIEATSRIANKGYEHDVPTDELHALARESITAVTDDEPGTHTADATGWCFSDLTPVLDGTHKPAQPDVGARDDGIGMFYPGHINGITGESEAGKSWVALISCLVEMNRGNTVVYVDFEDSEVGVVARLLLIGANPQDIAERFLYVRPGATPSPAQLAAFIAAIAARQPTLAVVDGVTEGMSLLGLELKDNTDVARFGRMLLRPLANTGAAVVPLDHVVKNGESRGRYALGGVHKLNAVDGVQYILEAVKPFGINTEGRSRLRIAKDRPAQVRRHALPGGRNPMHWYADLVVKSHGEDFAEAHLYPPVERHDEPADGVTAEEKKAQAEEQAIKDREEVVLHVLAKASESMSTNALEGVISGRASVTRRALTRLVHSGRVVVEKGPRGGALHRLADAKGDAS